MSENEAPPPSEKFDLVARAKEEADQVRGHADLPVPVSLRLSADSQNAMLKAGAANRSSAEFHKTISNAGAALDGPLTSILRERDNIAKQMASLVGGDSTRDIIMRQISNPAMDSMLEAAKHEMERIEQERRELMRPPQIFFPPRFPREREIIREKEIVRETKVFVYIISSPFVAEEVRVETTRQNLFVRKGVAWLLGIDGDVRPASHQQGFEYIAYAIARPGQSLIHINVFDDLSKQDVFESTAGSDPKADDETIRAVKEEYTILKDDMEEAERDGLTVLAEKYREQMRPLGEYLSSRLAPGGRLRLDPDRDRKTRESINKAIRRALKDLETLHPALHYHLKRHLSLTPLLSYHPDTLPDWEL